MFPPSLLKSMLHSNDHHLPLFSTVRYQLIKTFSFIDKDLGKSPEKEKGCFAQYQGSSAGSVTKPIYMSYGHFDTLSAQKKRLLLRLKKQLHF